MWWVKCFPLGCRHVMAFIDDTAKHVFIWKLGSRHWPRQCWTDACTEVEANERRRGNKDWR